MKLWKRLLGIGCAALLGAAATTTSQAAGLLVADGGFGGVLEIKEHTVDVTVNNGIAITRVTEVFQNTEQRQVEALYTFPVPKGASVANFSMWINGKEMIGEVLEKKRAREIYESYKQTRKDPGLLEQVDYRTFEMRIFPIGPAAEQRVQITYYQELEVDHDWAAYVYPLATSSKPGLNSKTTGKFAFNIHAKSAVPIVEVESPSHPNDFVIAKHSPEYFQASLETNGGDLARDIVMGFHLSQPQTGVSLLASRNGSEDGYFALTLTPGEDLNKTEAGMDYVFLLDVSGSMGADGKLLTSKDSVNAFIRELSPEDRFEIMTFNVQPSQAFRQLRAASEENLREAGQFLEGQAARGGTILSPALAAAFKYRDEDRPLNVVILSDGLTEQEERKSLIAMSRSRNTNTRIFCIGVGNDVNRPMLEQVAQEAGGLAAFISGQDNFARQAKAFRRKLTRPAATALNFEIKGVEVYDLEPKKLPDLFHGSPVKLYGRYKGAGQATIALRASVNGRELKQSAAVEFPKTEENNPEIDRMWAWRRVDSLLKEADAQGSRDRVIPEIVRLGEGYSIVTEYTSFLVLENDAEYRRWKISRNNMLKVGADREAQARAQSQLEQIRSKAMAQIGPEAVGARENTGKSRTISVPGTVASGAPLAMSHDAAPNPAPRSNGGGGGTGPVGPLFILAAGLWRVLSGRDKNQK